MNPRFWNLYFESNTNDLLVVHIDAPTEMKAIKWGKEKFQSMVLVHSHWTHIDTKETE